MSYLYRPYLQSVVFQQKRVDKILIRSLLVLIVADVLLLVLLLLLLWKLQRWFCFSNQKTGGTGKRLCKDFSRKSKAYSKNYKLKCLQSFNTEKPLENGNRYFKWNTKKHNFSFNSSKLKFIFAKLKAKIFFFWKLTELFPLAPDPFLANSLVFICTVELEVTAESLLRATHLTSAFMSKEIGLFLKSATKCVVSLLASMIGSVNAGDLLSKTWPLTSSSKVGRGRPRTEHSTVSLSPVIIGFDRNGDAVTRQRWLLG